MAATAEIGFFNRDTLSVCLRRENPYRLVSLLEIMNLFKLEQLAALIAQIEGMVSLCDFPRAHGRASDPIDHQLKLQIAQTIPLAERLFKEIGLRESVGQLESAGHYLSANPPPNVSEAKAELRRITDTLIKELKKRRFLFVEAEFTEYVDNPMLFGKSAFDNFPSARDDIRDSGNCLAAGCSTATVFHLMRAAEHGLRALAWDRGITLPKGPIELATWDAIIKELEKAEQAIQGYPKTMAREAQFEFYHGAMMEFKRFKNKFRNRIMHTRDDYDSDEAQSAFRHVKEFMGILASKITENSRTPEIWI